MSIIADYVGFRGQFFGGQYIRVDKVSILNKVSMGIEVGIYFNKELATQEQIPHSVENFYGDYDLLSKLNPWQQAYDIVKLNFPDHIDDI